MQWKKETRERLPPEYTPVLYSAGGNDVIDIWWSIIVGLGSLNSDLKDFKQSQYFPPREQK